MIDYIFNEKEYIEAMIKSNYVDNNAPMKTIRLLARYCYFVLGFDRDKSYQYIVSYMNLNAMDFHEQRSIKRVKECINSAKDSGEWKNITTVPITKGELDKISSLNDEKQEKIAFVLLADAKYYTQCSGKARNNSYLSISDIFKLARVPCPYKERAYFLNFLFKDREGGSFAQREIYGSRRNNVVYKLNYVSYDLNDEVVLELNEKNYTELASIYLNWKNGGYKKCKNCGRLFKTKKEGLQIYCKKCAPKHEKIEYKTIECIDCGIEVYINSKSTKVCRCEECQRKADYSPIIIQVKKCKDCGKEFKVESSNRRIRCDSCHIKYQRNRNRIKNEAYRNRKNNA